MTEANTLFLRLEGPLQAWGDTSKFVIRRTMDAPTKSGVLGLVCCAMGLSRQAVRERLPELNGLAMGVRIDRQGTRWWDYHTVGAGIGMTTASGGLKTGAKGTLITRREYLCDASFLVALQGEPALIAELAAAMRNPKWTIYLGRKSCPMSRPPLEHHPGDYPDLLSALTAVDWRPRLKGDTQTEAVDCLLDWVATPEEPEAPFDAEIWYDVPLTFEPPSHRPRFVIRRQIQVGEKGALKVAEKPAQNYTPRPPRARADYRNSEYRKMREERLDRDHHLCVLCKSPATTVHHFTYRHAGGDERLDELRSLCRLCHDAVTMIEYGQGMGMDRINPEEERWRDQIIEKRAKIIAFRSLETQTRRRKLAAEEVE